MINPSCRPNLKFIIDWTSHTTKKEAVRITFAAVDMQLINKELHRIRITATFQCFTTQAPASFQTCPACA